MSTHTRHKVEEKIVMIKKQQEPLHSPMFTRAETTPQSKKSSQAKESPGSPKQPKVILDSWKIRGPRKI